MEMGGNPAEKRFDEVEEEDFVEEPILVAADYTRPLRVESGAFRFCDRSHIINAM